MNTDEIWRYNGLYTFTVYNKPVDFYNDETEYEECHLKINDCFTVVEDLEPENDVEHIICILFDNQKWYLEVAKSSVEHGLFKKL